MPISRKSPELGKEDDAGAEQGEAGTRGELRAASMRWTMSWSVPCEAMVRKVPPSRPAQKV